jgi:hypothetical protein
MSITIVIAVQGMMIRRIDNIPWHLNMNGQDAMEHAYHIGSGYSFLLQYFGQSLGYEVTSIDNVSSQAGSEIFLFWEFSVNNKLSQTGVDQTKLNDGDTIGWNYIPYNPKQHAGTRYAAIREHATKAGPL